MKIKGLTAILAIRPLTVVLSPTRSDYAAITGALSALLDQSAPSQPGQVTFLPGDKQPHRPRSPNDQVLTTCHG
jgi:hypothetical protein